MIDLKWDDLFIFFDFDFSTWFCGDLFLCFQWLIAIRYEDQGQLQLVDREEVEDEDDCFEAIDKRKIPLFSWISKGFV